MNIFIKTISQILKFNQQIRLIKMSESIFKNKCFLKSSTDLHPPLEITGNDKKMLGRSPETKIQDPHCSRNQSKYLLDNPFP